MEELEALALLLNEAEAVTLEVSVTEVEPDAVREPVLDELALALELPLGLDEPEALLLLLEEDVADTERVLVEDVEPDVLGEIEDDSLMLADPDTDPV